MWSGLAPGAAITRWAMTAADMRLFSGTARAMPDRVTYRFANDWTDVGDLPCREALKAALPGRVVACPTGPFADLGLGLDGGEMDFSRFCHRPTLIVRGFACTIRGNGPARLRIATCGGVRLWLDGAETAVFEPFSRNQPQTVAVELTLTPTPQSLILRLEDLHERDTTCFFALSLVAGDGVQTALPAGFDAGSVGQVADVLASLRTDGLFHESGPIRLVADVPPRAPLTLQVQNFAPFSRGGLVADPAATRPLHLTLTPDAPQAVLADVADAPPGCLSLLVETVVGSARLTRQLGTTTLPPGIILTGDLPARKAQAAAIMADSAGFEPSLATLLAARGKHPDRVASITAAVLTTIEERHDCSDFSILPLLRLWRDSRDRLDPALHARIRAALLGYRYWLDEPGDDVMWFWSENHVLCFHAAQLMAGRLFSGTVFANSGKTGVQHAAQASARLDRWFASINENGLCEWNSAAYYPIDMLGLFTLHDMAPDFRDRARHVLDMIFVMTALHTSGGVPAGTQGRCYEKELLAGPMTELGSVMALVLGTPYRPGYDRATALLCLSDYSPPPLTKLAAPPPGERIEARYTQGLGHQGKLSLWKSEDGQLSTATDLKTGQHGHQAQVVDVQLARHPMARLWLNHPGELKPWGDRRPSLLAGNLVMPRVAQAGPVALLIWDLERDWTDLPLTQVFADPGGFGAPSQAGGWQVFAGTVGVWCSVPVQPVTTGLYRSAIWRALGLRTAWAVTLRLPGETEAKFATRLVRAEMHFDAASLSLRAHGLGPRLSLEFYGPLRAEGVAQTFAPLSPLPHIARNGGPLTPWTADAD